MMTLYDHLHFVPSCKLRHHLAHHAILILREDRLPATLKEQITVTKGQKLLCFKCLTKKPLTANVPVLSPSCPDCVSLATHV